MHAHASSPSALWAVWALVLLALALYGQAAHRRAGWSSWRTTSFVAGGTLVLLAFAPPVVHWAHADLRGHMAQHLLLGMFAPLLLVLGAPVTLLLASVGAPTARRLVSVLHSRPARFITHPLSALVLNIGGMAVLYATPLFALSRTQPWLHALVHYHFLAAGYLFCWAIAGPDPAPSRPPLRHRGLVLFAGIALHSTLGKLMYVYGWPHGTGASLEEIRAAAQWMYYGGDLAELLLVAALLARWYRDTAPGRISGRADRHPPRTWTRRAPEPE